jgi:ankyrin repeat protein
MRKIVKLGKIIILLMAGATVASNQGMDFITSWFKKPYTTQVDWATDELKKFNASLFNGLDLPAPLPTDYDTRIKELILQGADPNSDAIPLFLAIRYRDSNLVRFLLEHGANPDSPRTLSPLIEAINTDKKELVEMLLEYDANPNLADTLFIWTPLMWAIAEPPKPEMVEILLRNPKLNLSVTDSLGRTALQMAETLTSHDPNVLSKRREIARLIREYQKTKLP